MDISGLAQTTIDGISANGTSAGPRTLFHWADYLVFAISLGIPLVIGVFFMFYKREESTTETFLTGERSMNFVAVALSILASLLNGTFVIGIPAEVHYYGIAVSYVTIGILLALLVSAHIFVPKYHAMMLTSAYEYIERRFNKPTRLVASGVFILSVVVFLAVVLYVPALAFAQVTNLTLYVTILITGVICTVYTAIGGIKAVVWTDAVQMVILLIGLIIIAILGAKEAGGGDRIWRLANENHRINFDVFSFDPRERVTFWTQVLGQGIVFLGLLISNQMMVQRYMGVSSALKAQLSLYIVFAFFLPLVVLMMFIGLVVHASYASCDPLFKQQITSGDQIFPLYVMDLLGDYHGVPGLITASIFAAALSSVSSVINALSAVCLEDYIDPVVLMIRKKPMPDRARRAVAVGIVVFFGVLTVGLSFAADRFTDKLIQATGTIWGVLGGPLAGIFILGFLLPCANSWGAITGIFSGLIFALWVCVGGLLYAPKAQTLMVHDCIRNITISLPPPPSPNTTVDTVSLQGLYDVSYGWYGVIGTGTCIIVGFIVSVLTGGCTKRYRSSLKSYLMYSSADNCCCCCPMSCKRCYRCGVDYDVDNVPPEADSDKAGDKPHDGLNESGVKSPHQPNGMDAVFTLQAYNYVAGSATGGVFKRRTVDGENVNSADYDVKATTRNGHMNGGYTSEGTGDTIL